MRGGLELLVVVLGILIALGVDRLVTEAADRGLESAYLSRLEADLVSDSAMLADRIEISEQGLERVSLLREAVRSRDASASNLYFAVVGQSYPPESSNATYREMESTGHLALLRSESVRQGVIGYYLYTESRTVATEGLMERGRTPLADWGWDSGFLLPTSSSTEVPPPDYDAEFERRLRRIEGYHAIIGFRLGQWQEEVQNALSLLRDSRESAQ
jgi:hypothetical protein